MKRIFLSIACVALAMTGSAQETYQSATLADQDLNGTARYVGMGGAMEALGADLSTMTTNPAGIGLFRRSQAALSLSVNSVGGYDALNGAKTKLGFDQVGIVFATGGGVNLGFNYHKSKNFNTLLNVSDRLNLASQNKLSAIKCYDDIMCDDNYSQVDYLYNHVLNGAFNDKQELVEDFAYWYNSQGYNIQTMQTGYTSAYDMNVSGNYNDVFYWGVTLGVKDLRYSSSSLYREQLLDGDDKTYIGDMVLEDSRIINGTGVDVKLGIVVRPIESSPFRIGAYLHTPTWYNMKTSNFTVLYNELPKNYGNYDSKSSEESMEYGVNTPMHFGFSLGHTVSNLLALGATYDYSDYSTVDNRIKTGGYNYYGDYDNSRSDSRMNAHTKEILRGVHTIKVGAELRVLPQLSLRAGYNYVSPKFKDNAYRDVTIESPGTYMSSTTDYINWKSTNRITAGLGFNMGGFTVDLAYQYSNTSGQYFPFASYYSKDEFNNVCDAVKVNNTRHQALLTLGYRF